MPLSLNLDIVTGDKNIYSGSASMVVVPGTLGELAILPNHANLLTTLSIGELRIFDDNNENSIAIGGGFLQIANNKREIKLGALKPTRDFNYVEDTVSGFVAALESDKAIGEVVNLGSNFEISIGDTVNTIADLMGTDIEILTDHQRLRPEKSEVERLWADNTKAKQLLKWQPKYEGITGFRKGLEKTIEWFLDQSNLKTYKSNKYNV